MIGNKVFMTENDVVTKPLQHLFFCILLRRFLHGFPCLHLHTTLTVLIQMPGILEHFAGVMWGDYHLKRGLENRGQDHLSRGANDIIPLRAPQVQIARQFAAPGRNRRDSTAAEACHSPVYSALLFPHAGKAPPSEYPDFHRDDPRHRSDHLP